MTHFKFYQTPSNVRAYELSVRFIRIQYSFILMQVFKMHADGVLRKFCHVHTFRKLAYSNI